MVRMQVRTETTIKRHVSHNPRTVTSSPPHDKITLVPLPPFPLPSFSQVPFSRLPSRDPGILRRGPPCNPAGRPKRRRFGCILPKTTSFCVQKIWPKTTSFWGNTFLDINDVVLGQNTPKTTSFWPPCRVAGRWAPQEILTRSYVYICIFCSI